MRQLRLRLRSSILFLFTAFTFFFLLTLNALISSSNELNPLAAPAPSASLIDGPSFWSDFHQSDIYELQAKAPTKKKTSSFSADQIEQLYQLIRSAREEKPSLSNSTWSLEKFLGQATPTSVISNETRHRPESAESAAAIRSSSGQTPKSMNEHDRRELRAFLRRRFQRWKDEHQRDALVTLAEIMHDSLAQDEPT